MTREEAIEVYNGLINTKIKEAFEFFAPELAESEDERIRKDIIECVEEQIRQGNYLNINRAKVIAYLEKQKGLTTENNMISSKKCNKSPLTDEAFKEQLERVLRNNVLDTNIRITGDTVIGAKLKEYFEQKEQKPDDDPLNDPKFLKGFDTGREVQRIFDEKKPAEWSEEDKMNLNGCICSLHQYGYMTYADFLKHLPERFNLQPKQEWSEEDEKRIQRICDFLWKNRKGDTDTIYQIEKDADWLKSLRPSWKPSEQEKGKESRKDWKPSEEQMEALREVAYSLVGTGTQTDVYLVQLYEQLKSIY